MPFNTQDTQVYRQDVRTRGNVLSASEREALLKKYLPTPTAKQNRGQAAPSNKDTSFSSGHKPRIRPYFRSILHLTIHLFIQFVFGIYIRIRQIWNAILQKFLSIRHYHHRTPAYIRRDTQSLSRLPQHLSVLLRYNPTSDDGSSLETLIDEVAELAAWSAAAGIPLLSVYEKTGTLKTYMSAVQELVHQKLVQYFGPAPYTPTLCVYAPNLPSLTPIPNTNEMNGTKHVDELNGGDVNHTHNDYHQPQIHLNLLLLSASDGRDTLVDLTRTLTEMSQSSKLNPKDITEKLINTEINATTSLPAQLDLNGRAISPSPSSINLTNGVHNTRNGNGSVLPPAAAGAMTTTTTSTSIAAAAGVVSNPGNLPSEPDLLLVFAPYVKLDGYPPWQIRLTEIFCVGDSGGDVSGRGLERRTRVEYQGFLRGLWKFAGAQMRFGS